MDLPQHGLGLAEIEIGVVGDQKGALDAEHLLFRAPHFDAGQAGVIQGLELLARDFQQFGMVVVGQGADEVIGGGPEVSQIVGGVVAFIEDEGDVLAMLLEPAIALDQARNDGSQGFAVMLVARVGVVKQGHMEIQADQQGDADKAQIAAVFFAFAPLRQLAGWVEGIDKGKEIGGVVGQAMQVEVEFAQQVGHEVGLDAGDGVLIGALHMVPKALAGEEFHGDGAEADERGARIPVGEGALALRRGAAIDGGQEQILRGRDSLMAFGQMTVGDFQEVETLGHGPGGGDAAKRKGVDFSRYHRGTLLIDGRDDLFGRAQAFLQGQAGLALDALRGDGVIVGMALDLATGNGRHALYNTLGDWARATRNGAGSQATQHIAVTCSKHA